MKKEKKRKEKKKKKKEKEKRKKKKKSFIPAATAAEGGGDPYWLVYLSILAVKSSLSLNLLLLPFSIQNNAVVVPDLPYFHYPETLLTLRQSNLSHLIPARSRSSSFFSSPPLSLSTSPPPHPLPSLPPLVPITRSSQHSLQPIPTSGHHPTKAVFPRLQSHGCCEIELSQNGAEIAQYFFITNPQENLGDGERRWKEAQG